MSVATFGKRGVVDTAPERLHREPASTPVPDMAEDTERFDDVATPLRRLQFGMEVIGMVITGLFSVICVAFPLYALATVKTPEPLGTHWYVFAVIFGVWMMALVFKSATQTAHDISDPKGFTGYMWRNPRIYVIGTALGVVAYFGFSGRSLFEVYTAFFPDHLTFLQGATQPERGPWEMLVGYIGLGWLVVGGIFYLDYRLMGGEP